MLANRSRKRWVFVLVSWASSTSSMMRENVVSSPTRSARTSRYPLSRIVPLNTESPTVRDTGSGSPVMVAWFTCAWPKAIVPSTAIVPPECTSTRSPGTTSSAATVIVSPSRRTWAVCGARSTRSRRDRLVFSSVRASSQAPKTKRNATTAASTYSPMMSAPTTAIVTRRSMLNAFARSAWNARTAVGTPAMIAAVTSAMSRPGSSEPRWRPSATSSSAPDAAAIQNFTRPVIGLSFSRTP